MNSLSPGKDWFRGKPTRRQLTEGRRSARGLQRARSGHAPDVVYEEIGAGQRAEGIDEYLPLLQGWEQAIPDGTGATHRTVESGDTVVAELVLTGTRSGDPERRPADTGRYHARFRTTIRDRGDYVDRLQGRQSPWDPHYVDIMTVPQQLGAGTTPSYSDQP